MPKSQVSDELVLDVRKRFPGAINYSDAELKNMLEGIEITLDKRDYCNQWTTGAETLTEQAIYHYDFYFDHKYHWIVRGDLIEKVVDPDTWAEIFKIPKMEDGLWYVGTTAVDPLYGTIRLAIEVKWHDGMARQVSLVAPDGDPIKRDLQRFQIKLTQLL